MSEPITIIHDHEREPADYAERKTAKAVVLNEEGKILMFPSALLGGGVEGDETYEEALHREILEEAGAQTEIIKPLGTIFTYRDGTKQKYVVEGYLCKYIETVSAPTSTDPSELKLKAGWYDPQEAVARLESQIKDLENKKPEDRTPNHQSSLHNRQIALAFIKEAFK